MTLTAKFEGEVAAWPEVSVHPHRFGGREFLYRERAEVGHVHFGGIVDIPFTKPIHDLLLKRGMAEDHHFVRNSGWITFRMHAIDDLAHGLWLMRLSYLRYALKNAEDPQELLEKESGRLSLDAELKSLLEPFIPNAVSMKAA
jgi:hypothetical protein